VTATANVPCPVRTDEVAQYLLACLLNYLLTYYLLGVPHILYFGKIIEGYFILGPVYRPTKFCVYRISADQSVS